MFECNNCHTDIPGLSDVGLVRVTGWGKPTSTGVKELINVSAPHGYLCLSCAFDLKTTGKLKAPVSESLFG